MRLPKRIVKLFFWGIIPLLVLVLAGQGNALQYQYHDLGTLGGNESEAHGINAKGWVVGMAQTTSGASHAFLKRDPTADMEDLDTLGGNYSSANGINAGGWVAGESETTSGASHAFLKNPDEQNLQDLDTLGGSYSYAYGINDKNNWVVGQSQTEFQVFHAFLKKPDDQQMQDLSTLGGNTSSAFAINAGGSVVGVSDISPGTIFSHAFLKNPDEQQMHDLFTLGGNFSTAYGINAGGVVVGESETTPDGNWHAFLKRGPADDMEDLDTLGGADSCAFGINAGGWVVGVSQIAPNNEDEHAFVQQPGAPMEDLNNLVQLPAGVVLVRAVAINDNGWIAGNAVDATQHHHAFLLIPNTNNDKPVANAGTSQSVALGDTVYLNGTSSSDPNGLTLVSYTWSFVTVPAGSIWAGFVLYSATPSFTPDLWGTYVITLVVNNGSMNSDPSPVNVLVTVTGHSAILSIQNLQTQISALKPDAFKNANMQNALLNKLNAVIATIDAGDYVDALNQLQQDILGKVTGKNSWITNPSAQTKIYKILTPIIAELKALS